jgi:hypothetical protein
MAQLREIPVSDFGARVIFGRAAKQLTGLRNLWAAQIGADGVGHVPGCLVGDAELALHLAGCHALVADAAQEHHVEPVLQRRAGAREGRSGLRVDVERAPLADIGRLAAQAVEAAFSQALRTHAGIAVAQMEQMVEAGVFCRKTLGENPIQDCFRIGRRHQRLRPIPSRRLP